MLALTLPQTIYFRNNFCPSGIAESLNEFRTLLTIILLIMIGTAFMKNYVNFASTAQPNKYTRLRDVGALASQAYDVFY